MPLIGTHTEDNQGIYRKVVNNMQPTLDDELKLEYDYKFMAVQKMEEVISKKVEDNQGARTAIGNRIVDYLFDTFKQNTMAWVNETLAPKRGVKPSYTPILRYITRIYDLEAAVNIMCLMTLTRALGIALKYSKNTSDNKTVSHVSTFVATDLREECKLQELYTIMNETEEGKKEFKKWEIGMNYRTSDWHRHYFMTRIMDSKGFKGTQFPDEDWKSMATYLLSLLIDSSDFFERTLVSIKGKDMEAIQATDKLFQTWDTNTSSLLMHCYSACPMIIPPKPWTTLESGGYYGDLAPFAKFLRLSAIENTGYFYNHYIKRLKAMNISGPMDAVNAIQATPWHIDTKVLAVVKQLIKMGGDRAGLPRLEPFKGLPRLHNPTPEELEKWKKKARAMYEKEARRMGRCIRMLATVKTAEHFASYERIYFPHNADFRGRIYPVPSFSPQGDDLNKGLLQFSDVPPLKHESDERWFLIAGAEFAGVDKVSFDDEIKWVEDNHENILETAKDPIGMLDWWGNLDGPFEFLQWCFEYARLRTYKETHNNSCIGFITGVPVAFDGTCSGLQHFSAILRDPIGAEAVNLKPSDKPQDIYGRVAVLVKAVCEEDAVNGSGDTWDEKKQATKYGTKTMAQWWLAFGINRKVTKRCVMTLAYGSKQFGFRNQILSDVIKPHQDEGIWTKENGNQAAGYMAKLIWNAVGKVVVKAVEGMKWLQAVAKMVCKNEQVVTWTTPMGLLVQQTYMSYKVDTIMIRYSKTRKRVYMPKATGEINKVKQANAVAPNFIHSMDASHLQMTVCEAKRTGINHFAMIHDSYGTTVANAEQLFHTVRECFVKMYTENDVLKNFADEMRLLTNEELPPLPEKGDFDVHEVLNSLYAFH